MRKKYIFKQWLIAIASFIGGILMLIPPYLIPGDGEIVLCGLGACGFFLMGISHLFFAYDLKLYNKHLHEKIKRETFKRLDKESKMQEKNELKEKNLQLENELRELKIK